MAKFRKKPVVIEAIQIGKDMTLQTPDWFKEALLAGIVKLHGMSTYTRDEPYVEIETLSAVTPNGESITVLDPKSVQRAFQDIASESAKVENEILLLRSQFRELDAFTKYCAQHYPEVINE